MAEETQETTEPQAAEAPAEAPTGDEAGQAPEATPAPDVEMVLCAVSKQEVPLAETVEVERKKGEVLRIHARYKKF